jgi:large subunit ribosomal protein L2
MSVRKLIITPGQRFRSCEWLYRTTDKPETLFDSADKTQVVNSRKDTMRYRVVVTSRDIVSLISNVQKKEFLTVKSIEYDPNRTAFIALLAYAGENILLKTD